MRTVDSNSRAAFLSAVATPEWRATIRRKRLDFGGTPLVYSTYNVIEASGYASDDRYGNYVWGDSCVTDSSGYNVRLINSAAWSPYSATPGDNSDFFLSSTTDGSQASHWNYTDIANPTGGQSEQVYQYCRIGVYPATGSDSVYVWYADASGQDVRRIQYSGSWSGATTGCEIGSWGGCAIHPVSESGAFVVAYTSPYLWIRAVNWSGSVWDSEPVWIVCQTDDIAYNDAHFSDAVHLSGTEYVILLNMARHGATYAIKYDSSTGVYSQPTLVSGGSAEWSGGRVKVTGATVQNGRIWAVVQKSFEASDEVPQATHTAIMSSSDGVHWREEDFVGVHPCYGKLLYNSGESTCFVAGNAAVYTATATQKLGTDVSAAKLELTTDIGYAVNVSGNAPHSLTIRCKDTDGTLAGNALLEAGNEVTLEARESGESYSTILTTYIERYTAKESFADADVSIFCKGPISKLVGTNAYRLPAGRLYEGPTSFYSDFNFQESGLARITVRQVSGVWKAIASLTTGRYELKGEKGGCLIPRVISSQWLSLNTHFTPKISVEGVFVVFFYEDDYNYWRAGITRSSGSSTTRLVIQRINNGALEADKDSTSFAVAPDTEVYFYLDIRPGRIRVYANTSNDQFNTGTTSVSYTTTSEPGGVPLTYHIGYECKDWIDYEDAIKSGTATSDCDTNTLTDTAQTFASTDVSKWIRVGDQWRQINDYTTTKVWVNVEWANPPKSGSEYGVYDDKESPYMLVRDIGYCDGIRAWTVDNLIDDVLEVAGVGRASVYSETINPLATANVKYDVDVRTTDATPDLILFASAKSSWSGWYVGVTASWITLSAYDVGTPTTVAVYPNLIDMTVIASTEIRFIYRENSIFVYAGDHYIGCFWNIRTSGSGYVAVPVGNTGSTTEFPRLQESFIWDEDKPPSAALAELLRGRPARMVEKSDGTVAISRFETHSDLGAWSTTVRETTDQGKPGVSMVMTEGADTRQFYLDKEQSRKGVLFRKVTTEYAEGALPTLREAVKLTRLAREEADIGEAEMYLPDLAAEIEDQIEIESTDYIVTGYNFSFSHARDAIQSGARYRVRTLVEPPTAGVWGTDAWGQTYWG